MSLTSYTVTVTTGVKDLTGNSLASAYVFAFTSALAAPDAETTPPTVVSNTPANNATGVLTSSAITVLFSEGMLLASITSTSVKLFLNSNNQEVTGLTYALSVDKKSLTITTPVRLNSTVYRVEVKGGVGGVSDLVGNVLVTTHSFTFTTKSAALVTLYSVGGNDWDDLYLDHYIERSVYIATSASTLIGRIPKTYKPILCRSGTPTGNWTLLWKRKTGTSSTAASSWTTFKTLYTASAAALANGITNPTTPTVDDSTNTSAFQLYDMVAIRYAEPGASSSPKVKVKMSTVEAFGGASTVYARNDGTTITTLTGQELAMEIIVEGI